MTALVLLAAALAWYFPIAFFLRSDWSYNAAGKSQMVFSFIVAIVLTLSVLRVFGVSVADWIRYGVYGAIVIGLAIQAITLTNIQNRRAARLRREARAAQERKDLLDERT